MGFVWGEQERAGNPHAFGTLMSTVSFFLPLKEGDRIGHIRENLAVYITH